MHVESIAGGVDPSKLRENGQNAIFKDNILGPKTSKKKYYIYAVSPISDGDLFRFLLVPFDKFLNSFTVEVECHVGSSTW